MVVGFSGSISNDNGRFPYTPPIAQNPYLYNAETKTFIAYQDPEGEVARTKYVKDNHLQGIMFWQYSGDPDNVLLDAIDKGLIGRFGGGWKKAIQSFRLRLHSSLHPSEQVRRGPRGPAAARKCVSRALLWAD